ncbi:MAG: ribbon-helix-helix domain-containing protein [Ignisphaera sp.]|uniref:Ribbon-helix-helix protein, CopG family n=1 Tax=Ignisphaera aggregans TaxID=334771 RepID=A0A7J3MYZ9_9CREN
MKENTNQIIEIEIPLTRVISIKIDVETLNETDIIFRKKGFRSRSELIREALVTYIELLKRFDRDELRKILSTLLSVDDVRKKR